MSHKITHKITRELTHKVTSKVTHKFTHEITHKLTHGVTHKFTHESAAHKAIHKSVPPILGNERGIALLITLSIITILFIVSMELNRRVRTSIIAAETSKTDYKLLEMARSGVNIAKAILVKDASENRTDSVQEAWSDPVALNKIVESLGFYENKIKVKITDEMGKIQVNALINEYPGHIVNKEQKKIWSNLLSFFISSDKSEDERDPGEIINCLIDWLDDGDGETITGISGAESPYYEALKIPYKCANREFAGLNELFFVKGISKNILSRAKSLNNIFVAQVDQDSGNNQAQKFQLSDLFTVFGADQSGTAGNHDKKTIHKKYHFPGKININTAPIPVIAAILPFGKQDLATKISEYRVHKQDDESGYTNDLHVKNWYAGIVGLSEKEKTAMAKIVTYSSNIFSIESSVKSDGRSLIIKAVVLREKGKQGRWHCKTLRLKMD